MLTLIGWFMPASPLSRTCPGVYRLTARIDHWQLSAGPPEDSHIPQSFPSAPPMLYVPSPGIVLNGGGGGGEGGSTEVGGDSPVELSEFEQL